LHVIEQILVDGSERGLIGEASPPVSVGSALSMLVTCRVSAVS
jgi:hypothetical protein